MSASAITWHRDGAITDRMAAPVAMTRDKGPFLLHPDADAFERAQGTLNELTSHGAKPPLHIHMMDARFLGTPKRRNPPRRTVAYNRRVGAENLTLRPLPGYHTLAPRGAIGGFPTDAIPFENKEDRVVWLGNMTGRMMDTLTPEGRTLRVVYNIRDHAKGLSKNSPEWDDVADDLMCVPRYNIVKTYRDHPDFEVGFVLRVRWKKLAASPAFDGLCHPKQSRTWFQKFRYILSLSGNDTGSNFLSAASSNALILMKEDGWELFYTDAFKPSVHYVPLENGAQDVVEKLTWARANPDKCKAMSDAATGLYDQFASPENRAAILTQIAAQRNAD
ncbi:glycosyl transferase family 90 [Octadecabacter sp.]|nr:glycosyl transferase family 90 [Octadecabacter sp.]